MKMNDTKVLTQEVSSITRSTRVSYTNSTTPSTHKISTLQQLTGGQNHRRSKSRAVKITGQSQPAPPEPELLTLTLTESRFPVPRSFQPHTPRCSAIPVIFTFIRRRHRCVLLWWWLLQGLPCTVCRVVVSSAGPQGGFSSQHGSLGSTGATHLGHDYRPHHHHQI